MVLPLAVQRYLESAFPSCARLITTINCSARLGPPLLTAEHNSNSFADVARLSNRELWKFTAQKSLHHQKPVTYIQRFDYPTRSQSLRSCRHLSKGTQWGACLPCCCSFLSQKRKKKANKSENTKLPVKSARLDIATDSKSNKD